MAYDNMEQFSFKDGFSPLIFNDVNLGEECEMYVLGKGTFNSPARDIDQIHVQGRNGDILIDNGGWNNIDVTYPDCAILSNFSENVEKLRGYLLGKPGYHTLIDPYHPNELRYAEFRGPFKADAHTGNGNDSGMFDLTFNCKPQRFLIDGMKEIRYVKNPVSLQRSSNYYFYTIDATTTNALQAYKFSFSTRDTITLANCYFYKRDKTKVAYDGPTVFNTHDFSIPLIGKDGTQYYGFSGEIRLVKTSPAPRMEYTNAFSGTEQNVYYFEKDEQNIVYVPFYNPTQFDAHPSMELCYKPKENSDTLISCGGTSAPIRINNKALGYMPAYDVHAVFDGVELTAKTYMQSSDVNYGYTSGDYPIITAGKPSCYSIGGVSDVTSLILTPMYYTI